MPKKRRHPYLAAKPNYVYTLSGGSSRATTDQSSSSTPPTPLTVNERLSQLRISQISSTSADQKRELAERSNQRSLPPSLGQGILGLTPTAAPRPRTDIRSRVRLRIAGPAPPPSWQNRVTPLRQVEESRYRRVRSNGSKRVGGAKKSSDIERTRPDQLGRFTNLIDETAVGKRSLLHSSLKAVAENWEAITEDCLEDLDYLPVHLRSTLLSYLSIYGPPQGIDIRSVQALFPGVSEAACLDFSGLAGWDFSLKELKRWLTTPHKSQTDEEHIDGPAVPKPDDLAESWEEEVTDERIWTPISQSLTTRLPFLTKLSLAHPPPSISWNDLLSISKDLSKLTHLSLADWPIPTRTPNMKTATYMSRTGSEQAAGATTLYSAFDKDFQESTIILRQLSEHTYCLRWLDLKGCSDWLPALRSSENTSSSSSSQSVTTMQIATADAAAEAEAAINPPEDGSESEWAQTRSTLPKTPHGPDWRGAWRNITYLNTSQDSLPTYAQRQFMQTPAFKGRIMAKYFHLNHTHLQIIKELKTLSRPSATTTTSSTPTHCHVCHFERNGSGDADCDVCTSFYDVETVRLARWLEREADAWSVGRSINLARVGGAGSRCTFDHGWQTREVYPSNMNSWV